MVIMPLHLQFGTEYLKQKFKKMKNKKPLILVVNDDGLKSNGINVLTNIVRELGEVFVVAPSENKSAVSHGMTLYKDIVIERMNNNEFTCSGTPVDCVKLAIDKILPRTPDLCVSGINHGSNHSINSLYSGTLHGAMEATIHGVPSLSFSHLSYDESKTFNDYQAIIKQIISSVLINGLPESVTLNINIPDVDSNNLKGIKLCNQAQGKWTENYILSRKEGSKDYYKLNGTFEHDISDIKSDAWALENKFISVVPVHLDCSVLQQNKFLKYLQYDF